MEHYNEDLKKKHIRYAWKQKQTLPTAEPQWLLTPSFWEHLWGSTLDSLLRPHSLTEAHPPPSSFQLHPTESTQAWPPSCPPLAKKLFTDKVLQSLQANRKRHCRWVQVGKEPRNTILSVSASQSSSRSPREMWLMTWWLGPDTSQNHCLMCCIRKTSIWAQLPGLGNCLRLREGSGC